MFPRVRACGRLENLVSLMKHGCLSDRPARRANCCSIAFKLKGTAFQLADDSSVTFTSVRNSLQMSMIQNSFSSWSVEASAWVTLLFNFHVSIMTRFSQWGRLRWIFWWCEGQWRSIIRGYQDCSQGNNDGPCQFIVQCTFTMHGLDVYYDSTASFNSSRVWRSFSTAMTSKCRTFAKSSSAPKAEVSMVSRGFIVGLVSFVSLVIMKRLPSNIYVWTGTIFSCSALLGARLHSTVEASSCLEVTEHTTKEKKTAAVSASFSCPFASGSVGSSYANATEDGQGHKKEDKSGRMNWEARGGTTFLAVEWVRLWKGVWPNTESIFPCMIVRLLGSTPLACTRIGEW